MFIKLTNAAKEHKGKALILGKKYILSVFPAKDDDGKAVTVVYGALKDSWSVKETPEQVWAMLEEK